MGHRKKNAPKRGSLAFLPRGRAARLVGKIRYWPEIEEGPTLLGFMGYKAGMTHVFMVEDWPGSPDFGKEVARPATVVEVPPVLVCALRAYERNEYGLQTLTEAWMKNPPEDLKQVITMPENFDPDQALKKIAESLNRVEEFRLLTITQPKLTDLPKKKPDIMEIKVGGGSVKEQFEYAKGSLGKTISAYEVFKEGQFVDVVAVTTGKGLQGSVKRWGVKIRSPKSRKTKRGVATLGPWKPSRVLYTVPKSGQMGFHQRTEYNKRILKMGSKGDEVTPKGDFLRYGRVRGSYILLNGSVPGTEKRLIRLRYPARPPGRVPEASPKITYVSVESPQGG